MCVDYTDLNQACPKDPFPLPRIDQLVDETAGCDLLSFMDAFRGYHQIFMHPADEEKTAFITPDGVYCYRVMPFGLKNAGATYTRMVGRLFRDLLGKSMAAYVDDMLVKSKDERTHAGDLASTFAIMEKYNLRLNPKKCAFAVRGGKFLGYMVTRKGIEPNPEKVKAILDMQPPGTLKELQRLTGRLAALNRFLSKSADRALPFFEAMKKREGFRWTEECQKSFDELKDYLQTPPLLSTSKEGEVLFLYLAASQKAVSSVLIREEERVQHPVYYVSRALKASKIRYTPLEKVVYALVITARKLVPYLQAHPIRVLTDQPLAGVLRNPKSSACLVKWAVELTQYGIEYHPHPSVKGQALADFIVECTAQSPEPNAKAPEEGDWWEMHADGAASQHHCGGGIMLTTPEGFRLYYSLTYEFRASNNEAEYEAVIGGLRMAKALKVQRIRIKTDSRLVVGQVTGTCEVKNERLGRYKKITEGLLGEFEAYELEHVPRAENTEADILSKIALGGIPDHLIRICQNERILLPSIEPKVVPKDEIHRYKENGDLPDDPVEAAKILRQSPAYVLIDGHMYKKSFGGSLLRCLFPSEANQVMEEAHRGICSAHQGAHMLARKIVLQGYYWPTMVKDCTDRVARCAICQSFAKKDTRPTSFYTPITVAIPFAKWGIDTVGPLPQAPGRLRFCVVAVDFFTKWVEAEPLSTITEFHAASSFGGRSFVDLGSRSTWVSIAYPQANGHVENVNRTIVDGIRRKLNDLGGIWVDELDRVLWAYRTTPRRAIGKTPFSLTYGFEAMVPSEITTPTLWVLQYNDDENEENLQIEKNFLEERRDATHGRMAEYQQSVKRYYDKRVKEKKFQEGDLVLRDRDASQPNQGGKFAIKWEGPYRIREVIRPGTYRLKTPEGQAVERKWNAVHLKEFFQ
ncbi:uncharacterized protein LOC116015878 [Ipomoea triloba]|uniref:uncharacterized protein LOC116015878 n=1 Tax=Ipomoea triloba TaxID=35885 RepID=UPI00125DC63E|nr:uncharacterized protein LOC116015878 [Ipomoea triloba]